MKDLYSEFESSRPELSQIQQGLKDEIDPSSTKRWPSYTDSNRVYPSGKIEQEPTRKRDTGKYFQSWVIFLLAVLSSVTFFALVWTYAASFFGASGTSELQLKSPTPPPTVSPIKVQPNPYVAVVVREEGGKLQGYLNASAFFESNQGRSIANEADFKQILTSFLLGGDKISSQIYRGNPDELWDAIVRLNPKAQKELKGLLRNGQFRLSNGPEQRKVLESLLIYSN